MNKDSNILLAKMELENGGKLEYKTYAQFIGKSGKMTRNSGGLLFFVANKIIFEDFEKQRNSIFSLFGKKSEYVKLKLKITASEIERINLVNLFQAIKTIKYNNDPKQLTEVLGLRKLLFRNVTQILLKDGSAYYFEIFDVKGFMAFMSNSTKTNTAC